jgi:hypothetical protein
MKWHVVEIGSYDPERELFDFMTNQAMRIALQRGFCYPFHVRLVDANETLLRKSKIMEQSSNGNVREEYRDCWKQNDTCTFPLTSKLTDAKGKTCEYTLSGEQMRQWLESAPKDEKGQAHVVFPADLKIRLGRQK